MQKTEELRVDGSGADRVLSQGRKTPCYWRVTAVTHGVKASGGEEDLAIPASRFGRRQPILGRGDTAWGWYDGGRAVRRPGARPRHFVGVGHGYD